MKPYVCTNNGVFEISQTDEENIFSESHISMECLSINDEDKSQNNFNNGELVDIKEIKHGKNSTFFFSNLEHLFHIIVFVIWALCISIF